MSDLVRGFVLGAVSSVLAFAVAMVVTVISVVACKLVLHVAFGRAPDLSGFFVGFVFASVFWPMDRRIDRWLRTTPLVASKEN